MIQISSRKTQRVIVYRRLLALMRIVLDETGASTKREAQGYTMHSARHTLPLIARLRGESAADRQEIGRWSMSTAQDPAWRPLQSIVKCHIIAVAVLPDRYAQAVPAQAAFDVMERQVTAEEQLFPWITLTRLTRKINRYR